MTLSPVIVSIFPFVSGAISLYTLLCLVRIFLTWIPEAERSAVGRFLSRICDPYLDLFKKLDFLRFGAFDLSPIVALGVLWAFSYLLNALSAGSSFSLHLLIEVLLGLAWQIASSVLWMFLIFLIIRLIVLLFSKSTYGTIWDQIDRSISPILFRIAAPFYRGKPISFKGALIISAVTIVVFELIGRWCVQFLVGIVRLIPM